MRTTLFLLLAFLLALLLAFVTGGIACSGDETTPGDASKSLSDHGLAGDRSLAGDYSLAGEHSVPRDTSGPPSDHSLPADRGTRHDAGTYVHENKTPQQIYAMITANQPLTIVDVRTAGEFSSGHLQNAINLPWASAAITNWASIPKTKPVVIYCASGMRSEPAAKFLADRGYRPVYDMTNGISGWKSAGLPTVQ